MSCIKSFTFTTAINENAVAPQLQTWGLAPQNYWAFESGAGISTFNIQGFKNVNIHGIEAVGDMASIVAFPNLVLVNDWSFRVRVNGQNSLVSGNITAAPNRYNITVQANNPIFSLSRYNPYLELASPIQSATSIQLVGYRASGIGAQNLAAINLAWDMTFVVYYSYEGE